MQHSLTFGLEFTGNVDYPLVDVTLFDVLNVAVADICGVLLISSHHAVVKLISQEVYREFIEHYDGRTFHLSATVGSMLVSDRNGTSTYVSVHGPYLNFLTCC